MIRHYSYPRIIFATSWRGVLFGSQLGAVIAVITCILYGIPQYWISEWLKNPVSVENWLLIYVGTLLFAAIGGGVGGAFGFVLGTVNGLYLSAITWLCRPHYQTEQFVNFCTITVAILSFLLVLLYFRISAGSPLPVINLGTFIALITAVIAGWAARRGTKKIAAYDECIRLGK